MSVVYEQPYLIKRTLYRVAYAIVVDTMTGKRVLMADMVKNREKFSDYLIAAYEKGDWEFDFFLDEERAAGILNFGSMTEAEAITYQISHGNRDPQSADGHVVSHSWMFDTTSFYMTEEAFVVMPGANCYEPIFLPWDEVEDAVYTGDDIK